MKCRNCGKEIENYAYPGRWLLCEDCFKAEYDRIGARQGDIILEAPPKVTVVKADKGKPRLDLVPLEVLYPLAKVREYGLSKYGESSMQNWKQIEDKRYLAALLRHLVAYSKDNNAVDEESGLPAIYHVLCNTAFLAIKHMEKEKKEL